MLPQGPMEGSKRERSPGNGVRSRPRGEDGDDRDHATDRGRARGLVAGLLRAAVPGRRRGHLDTGDPPAAHGRPDPIPRGTARILASRPRGDRGREVARRAAGHRQAARDRRRRADVRPVGADPEAVRRVRRIARQLDPARRPRDRRGRGAAPASGAAHTGDWAGAPAGARGGGRRSACAAGCAPLRVRRPCASDRWKAAGRRASSPWRPEPGPCTGPRDPSRSS